MINLSYKEKLTCQQFIDQSGKFEQRMNDYIQDSYWSEDFSTEKAWQILKIVAVDEDIELTDEEDFDYVSEFENIYKVTEKGLS